MTCSTCRNFRRGVAAGMGYCGLDKTHAVLSGEEIRACWQAPAILEPAEGLFESLNMLLTPKPSASLAMAGPGSQSVASVPAALPRTIGGTGEPRGGARPRDGDDDSSGVVPGRLREVPGEGVRARLARATGRVRDDRSRSLGRAAAAGDPRAQGRRAVPIAAATSVARGGPPGRGSPGSAIAADHVRRGSHGRGRLPCRRRITAAFRLSEPRNGRCSGGRSRRVA